MEQTTQDAKHLLAQQAEEALRVVSNSAADAARVISQAAAEAVKVKALESGKDHDLIQRMDEKLDALARDFKDLKLGTADRIKKLEEEKASGLELDKIYYTRTPKWAAYDSRIESLEVWRGERSSAIKANDVLLKWIIAIGILLVGMFVWHLTGFKL